LAVATAHVEEAHHTSTGLNNRKMVFWAFLGSECMFFGSLIATYLVYRGRDTVGPHPAEIFSIPFTTVSAFVLLMSSLTMVLALAAIQQGRQKSGATWIAATALLGMLFVAGQVYEFSEFFHKGLALQTNLFGCSFYVLTGFHGTHVTIGVIWLWSLWSMAVRGKLPPSRALDVEIGGLYWHFVDIVWIAIFTLIYLIQ
jgi:cytochrome c oxidase subunit 3/cytochrome o ubiquinol oxidase subunit 3